MEVGDGVTDSWVPQVSDRRGAGDRGGCAGTAGKAGPSERGKRGRKGKEVGRLLRKGS